jgi:hypothetical protein
LPVLLGNEGVDNAGLEAGGVYNDGTLTDSDCTISGNTASPRGGGIYNIPSGTLALAHSLVSGNSASDAGGGIYNAGTVTVSFTTLSSNGSATADGGAIFNEGTLTVTNSTLSGNGGASGYGGAIRNDGMLTVEESTFAGNAANLGGAIYNTATLLILDSTISTNSAEGDGGGVDNLGTAFSARNTIIAGNTAVTGSGPELNGVLVSLGHNLIGNTGGASGFVASDLLNVDPLLGPLQDNGGPTQTMALLPGSPAICAGDNTDAPQYDQRGPSLPRIVNGTIDIGAFEVPPPPARSLPAGASNKLNFHEIVGITATILESRGPARGNDLRGDAPSIPDPDLGAVVLVQGQDIRIQQPLSPAFALELSIFQVDARPYAPLR